MTELNSLKILPDWARWIARDENGSWWCYEAEPHRHDTGWYENEVGRIQKTPLITLELKWQDSLTAVNPLDFPEQLPRL